MAVEAHNVFVDLVSQVHLLFDAQLAVTQFGVEFVLHLDHMINVLFNFLLSVDGRPCELNHQLTDLDFKCVVDHLWDEVVLGQRLHLLLASGDQSRNCHGLVVLLGDQRAIHDREVTFLALGHVVSIDCLLTRGGHSVAILDLSLNRSGLHIGIQSREDRDFTHRSKTLIPLNFLFSLFAFLLVLLTALRNGHLLWFFHLLKFSN